MSALKYELLGRYDNFLCSRKDKLNRYYVFFLFFYKDYFINKIINKIMRSGNKYLALSVFRKALFFLKKKIGFQPFFFFKNLSFSMRQIFKVQKSIIRQIKITYLPLILKPHNQVTYGINHIIKSASQLVIDEKKAMSDALCIVLLNCFISN